MKYLLLFILASLFNVIEAQELRYEINSADANMSIQECRLNWSLGGFLDFDMYNDDVHLSNPWLFNDVVKTVVSNGSFVLYPNPSFNFVSICVDDYRSLPYKLTVYNINGEKVFVKNITSNHESIALSKLSSGMYFFEYVKDGKRIGMNKMLKE